MDGVRGNPTNPGAAVKVASGSFNHGSCYGGALRGTYTRNDSEMISAVSSVYVSCLPSVQRNVKRNVTGAFVFSALRVYGRSCVLDVCLHTPYSHTAIHLARFRQRIEVMARTLHQISSATLTTLPCVLSIAQGGCRSCRTGSNTVLVRARFNIPFTITRNIYDEQ